MSLSTKLFSWRELVLIGIAFAALVLFMQRTVLYACSVVEFDCPYYFPISIFNLRVPGPLDLFFAATVVSIFFLAHRVLESTEFDLRLVAVVAILLIVGGNLIQGVDAGLTAPVAGDYRGEKLIPNTTEGQEYYHDAIKIENPLEYFRTHNEKQLSFNQHGRTHPPGTILVYYFLYRIFHDPALIAIALCIIASIVSVLGAYRLFRHFMDDDTARFLTFLFMLVPAVQIYYVSTIDALVTGLLTLSLAYFCSSENWKDLALSSLALTAAFLLTFASLFLLPVLVGYELLKERSLRRSIVVIGGLFAFHLILYFLLDYNAWTGFRTASAYENPNGFQFFVSPINYLFTRIEDVAEILLFLGPFLAVLMSRGLRGEARPGLLLLTFLGIATLLAMFVTGAWKTGETARACAFIYPFLLLPVGALLNRQQPEGPERLQLATLVFSQAVVMQLFGFYLW